MDSSENKWTLKFDNDVVTLETAKILMLLGFLLGFFEYFIYIRHYKLFVLNSFTDGFYLLSALGLYGTGICLLFLFILLSPMFLIYILSFQNSTKSTREDIKNNTSLSNKDQRVFIFLKHAMVFAILTAITFNLVYHIGNLLLILSIFLLESIILALYVGLPFPQSIEKLYLFRNQHNICAKLKFIYKKAISFHQFYLNFFLVFMTNWLIFLLLMSTIDDFNINISTLKIFNYILLYFIIFSSVTAFIINHSDKLINRKIIITILLLSVIAVLVFFQVNKVSFLISSSIFNKLHLGHITNAAILINKSAEDILSTQNIKLTKRGEMWEADGVNVIMSLPSTYYIEFQGSDTIFPVSSENIIILNVEEK